MKSLSCQKYCTRLVAKPWWNAFWKLFNPSVPNRDVVIVGFGGDAVQNYLGNRAEFVRQEEQNGTGHAVKMAQPVLG